MTCCLMPSNKVDDLFLFQHVTEPTRYRSSDNGDLEPNTTGETLKCSY